MDTTSFDIVMEFLSKKDEEYFDSKIPDVEKSITEAKNYIKKFYVKKRTLDTYLKNNPDAKDEDNSIDVDKEYEKGLTLYSNAIKELYNAQKCIEINLVPENKGTLSKVHTASTIAMVLGFVYFVLTLMIRKDKTTPIEAGVGLGLTGIGGVISKKTDNIDYSNKWKEKLAEYKQKKNLSVWESLELVERQIKDLIGDFESKYPFYNKR